MKKIITFEFTDDDPVNADIRINKVDDMAFALIDIDQYVKQIPNGSEIRFKIEKIFNRYGINVSDLK